VSYINFAACCNSYRFAETSERFILQASSKISFFVCYWKNENLVFGCLLKIWKKFKGTLKTTNTVIATQLTRRYKEVISVVTNQYFGMS
jgi:hypothetical protein